VRVLRADGTFWLAIGDEFAAELKLLFQNDLGLKSRSWVIWYYTFGVNCKQKFSRSHAHLFYFVKDAKHFTFNADAIRVPSARQLRRRWLGFELSSNYAAQVEARLADVKEGQPLNGAEEPRTSAPATADGKRVGSQRRR